jgi:phosphoribosylformylglycinamidine synthase PurS subunit
MNQLFRVSVLISNKPAARDPEGETIHRDLASKSGFAQVKSIRVGKLLRISVEAQNRREAERLVLRMCDELRIYNPAAHRCEVVREESDS